MTESPRIKGGYVKLTSDQLIYIMEIAAKNGDAYSMKPLELFSAMCARIREEIADGEADDEGTEKNS